MASAGFAKRKQFLRFLMILARFWEALGPPKIRKNQKKSIFDRVQFRRRVLGGFWEGFGRILGGFGEDFGKVFWLDFGKILGIFF